MKLQEAIDRVDALKFNTYSNEEKISWISELDNAIKNTIIDTHEGWWCVKFEGYDENSDPETVLLVPPPFDSVYLRWLEAQIDYHSGEYNRFNASMIMYNSAFDAYANFYKRNHMPRSRDNRFKF